jgi:hypothetical protein
MSRLLIALIGFSILVGPGTAMAAPLGIGDTALFGTTVVSRPELAGTIVEDVLVPYDFSGSGGEDVFGDIQNRVVLSDDGTYDFYWRILPDPESTGEITAFRVAGFDGFALDGDFRLDGLGDVGPDIARNFGGGFVNFLFSDGVDPDETSRFFFLDTEATSYASIGFYDLLCADSGCVSPSFDTFAPTQVPEPTTMALLTFGAAALLRRNRRRLYRS